MSPAEFGLWQRNLRDYPPQYIRDLRTQSLLGQILCAMYNWMRSKDSETVELKDVVPWLFEDERKKVSGKVRTAEEKATVIERRDMKARSLALRLVS